MQVSFQKYSFRLVKYNVFGLDENVRGLGEPCGAQQGQVQGPTPGLGQSQAQT